MTLNTFGILLSILFHSFYVSIHKKPDRSTDMTREPNKICVQIHMPLTEVKKKKKKEKQKT